MRHGTKKAIGNQEEGCVIFCANFNVSRNIGARPGCQPYIAKEYEIRIGSAGCDSQTFYVDESSEKPGIQLHGGFENARCVNWRRLYHAWQLKKARSTFRTGPSPEAESALGLREHSFAASSEPTALRPQSAETPPDCHTRLPEARARLKCNKPGTGRMRRCCIAADRGLPGVWARLLMWRIPPFKRFTTGVKRT